MQRQTLTYHFIVFHQLQMKDKTECLYNVDCRISGCCSTKGKIFILGMWSSWQFIEVTNAKQSANYYISLVIKWIEQNKVYD